MKETILSIIFLAFTFSGIAQSQIGLKVGYLMPNYKVTSHPPNSNESFSMNNGINYGLNYKRRWPGLFNFGAEMEYNKVESHFTMEYKPLGADVYREVGFTTNYLNFRLLPEFVYGEKLRSYFQVGPYMGFLLASNVNGLQIVNDGNAEVTIVEDGSATDDFPAIDWGIFFGVGAEYPIAKSVKLAVELQYSRGFAGYAQSDKYVFATKNITASISFIYVFRGYAERIDDDED